MRRRFLMACLAGVAVFAAAPGQSGKPEQAPRAVKGIDQTLSANLLAANSYRFPGSQAMVGDGYPTISSESPAKIILGG